MKPFYIILLMLLTVNVLLAQQNANQKSSSHPVKNKLLIQEQKEQKKSIKQIKGDEASQYIADANKILIDGESGQPRLIQFKSKKTKALDFLRNHQAYLKMGKGSRLESYKTSSDRKGSFHTRLKQYFQDVEIEGGEYILHEKDGFLTSANGRLFDKIDLNTKPTLSGEQALQLALNHLNAKTYMWEKKEEETLLQSIKKDPNATYFPKGKLIITSKDYTFEPGSFRLTYQFDIYTAEPLGRWYLYVDAHTGAVVNQINRIQECFLNTGSSSGLIPEVTHSLVYQDGSGVSFYNGTVPLKTEFINGNYRLRGVTTNGGKIETYDLKHGENHGQASDFIDSDNFFDTVNDKAAVNVHWGTEKTFEYYFSEFGRNSFDDFGMTMRSYVHYGNEFFNAFWDGEKMTYGDGTSNMTPLVSIDIVAHELTHGMTQFSSNLFYYGESGALNESFSDIFAAVVEFKNEGNDADWLLGESVYGNADYFRSMSDPKTRNQPDMYFGDHWYVGNADNGGVHINSGVQNYWFYLLSQGGSGTNDSGYTYNVTGIGLDKAAEIAYWNVYYFLTPGSRYDDARFGSEFAAINLYGENSQEHLSVVEAWNAVGVSAVNDAPLTYKSISVSLEKIEKGSAAWGDYDNDGDLDLVIGGRNDQNVRVTKLYRNDGNDAFTNSNISLQGINAGSTAWGDYDNDGDLDLLLAGTLEGTKIYRNDGNGSFAEINAQIEGNPEKAVWGDYNNDGLLDVLVLGYWGSVYNFTTIYKNNGDDNFSNIHLNFPGGLGGSGGFIDYDSDGDLDIFYTNDTDGSYTSSVARLYRNNNGTFQSVNSGIFGLGFSSCAWGDYDNDGDPDLLMSGSHNYAPHYTLLYKNNGGTFQQVNNPIQNTKPLPAITEGVVRWLDYDVDGDTDILITGFYGKSVSARTVLCRNNENGFFEEAEELAPGYWTAAEAGDYDNDNDLDLFWSGVYGLTFSTIYNNTSTANNNKPLPPNGNFSSVVNKNTVTLQWGKGSDTETPQNGLSYNIRVGTMSDGNQIISSMSDNGGFRKRAAIGNMGSASTYTLKRLVDGTYYWSVQAIDHSLIGSNFSDVQEFTVSVPPYVKKAVKDTSFTRDFGKRFIASLTDVFADSTSPIASFGVSALSTGIVPLLSNDSLYVLSTPSFIGVVQIRVTASDAMSTVADTFNVTTFPNAFPTVINPIRDTTFANGFGTVFIGKMTDVFNDADNTELTYDGVCSPNVLRPFFVNDSLFFQSVIPFEGNVQIFTTASDPFGATATDTFAIILTQSVFTELETESVGIDGEVQGSAWGDYDGDGDWDLADPSGVIFKNDNGVYTGINAIEVSGQVLWGDYDNDGDLDLLSIGGVVPVILYRNDGGTFTNIHNPFSPLFVGPGKFSWGDYDNDGDLDVLAAGPVQSLYRNDKGSFTPTNQLVSAGQYVDYDNDGDLDVFMHPTNMKKNQGNGTFVTVNLNLNTTLSYSAWGDYDGDGDMDLALAGFEDQLGATASKVFQNNGVGQFTMINTNFEGTTEVPSWIDYDNDGDLDLILQGFNPNGEGKLMVYENKGHGAFDKRMDLQPNLFNTFISVSDYDNDGDLDLLYAGTDFTNQRYKKIYRNNSSSTNQSPDGVMFLAHIIQGKNALLTWEQSTDDKTPAPALTYNYNLRMGQSSGGVSDTATGKRYLPQNGNAGSRKSYTVKNLDDGTYYWSVQTIDNQFAGSTFSEERSFTISFPPYIKSRIPDTLFATPFSKKFIRKLTAVFGDSNTVQLNYFAETLNSSRVVPFISRDSLYVLSDNVFLGAVNIRVTASDLFSTVADTFMVTIGSNTVPNKLRSIRDTIITEDTHEILIDSLYQVFQDPEGLHLDFEVTKSNSKLEFSFFNDELYIVPLKDSSGSVDMIVSAKDSYGASVSDTFQVLILPVNDPPVISYSLRDTAIERNHRVVTYYLPNHFTDIDDQTLNYTAANLSNGLTPLISNDSLYVIGDLDFTGNVEIKVSANDGQYEASDTFAVNIYSKPVALSQSLPDTVLEEDFGQFFVYKLSNYFSDAQNFSINLLNDGLTILVTHDSLYMESVANFNGIVAVEVVATAGEMSVSDTFSVTVNPVNDAPVQTALLPDVIYDENFDMQTYALLSEMFADVEQPLTYAASRLSPGINVHATGDTLMIESVQDFVGQVLVRVTASDGEFTIADTFKVSVLDKTPPAISVSASIASVNVVRLGIGASEELSSVEAKANDRTLPLSRTGDLYFGNYTLGEAVQVDFKVKAADGAGNTDSVSKRYQISALNKSAEYGNYVMNFPVKDGYVLLGDANILNNVPPRYAKVVDPVEILPTVALNNLVIIASYSQAKINDLRAQYDDFDEGKIGIYQWKNQAWEYVGAQGEGGRAIATLRNLGKQSSTLKLLDIEDGYILTAFYNPDHVVIPKSYALKQNYPNPFNPTTTIRFDLPEATKVTLKVYNILGQHVRTLVDGEKPAGFQSVIWDGRNSVGQRAASGIYIYRLEAGSFKAVKKMVLIK